MVLKSFLKNVYALCGSQVLYQTGLSKRMPLCKFLFLQSEWSADLRVHKGSHFIFKKTDRSEGARSLRPLNTIKSIINSTLTHVRSQCSRKEQNSILLVMEARICVSILSRERSKLSHSVSSEKVSKKKNQIYWLEIKMVS